MGNLTEVYGSANRLSGYLSFHENFGKIVQIFWLWKQQISVASYAMAHHILQARASHYQKYHPNALTFFTDGGHFTFDVFFLDVVILALSRLTQHYCHAHCDRLDHGWSFVFSLV
ncbi:hypothetical protein JX360_07845 [Synechococcus bigranulatus str. 'Rupite']|uniref:Uncharacterized protein n=1 Tax=Thermostichus vulcanus str. 'Rupite' TaxID=2813851 RepID=A0ABT0CAM0_THEVL|nr:hypothetical protein [Thermostichus vulcanus str. 'Rupite']